MGGGGEKMTSQVINHQNKLLDQMVKVKNIILYYNKIEMQG